MTRKEELEAQGYKTYENEDIQVFWKPRICQHAGECEFEASGDRWVIMHTGVREAYEGKGIARKLVLKVIEAARAKGVKILPVCSYAKKMMTGKEEFKDVI